MPEQESKQKERPVSFRASKETRRQIDALMQQWGENRSQVIVRAIQVAWHAEVKQAPAQPVEARQKEE